MFLRKTAALLILACLPALPVQAVRADTIADALTLAIENSDRLERERYRLRISEERIHRARSGKELSASLNAGYTARDKRLYNTFEGSTFGANREVDDSISVSIRKNIYDGGRTRLQVDIAEMEIESARLGFQDQIARIMSQAIKAYVELATAREIALLKRSALAAGTGSTEGVADFSQDDQRIASAERDYMRAVGSPPPDVMVFPPIPAGLPATAEEMEKMALAGNIRLRQSKTRERVERRQLDDIAIEYRPNMNIRLSATRSGSNPEGAEPRTESDSGSASLSLDFNMPLYIPPSRRSSARTSILRHRLTRMDLRDDIADTTERAGDMFFSFDSSRTAYEQALETFQSAPADTPPDILIPVRTALLESRARYLGSSYDVLEFIGNLTVADFGITTDAARADDSKIGFPVRPLPYPHFVHPDEK